MCFENKYRIILQELRERRTVNEDSKEKLKSIWKYVYYDETRGKSYCAVAENNEITELSKRIK